MSFLNINSRQARRVSLFNYNFYYKVMRIIRDKGKEKLCFVSPDGLCEITFKFKKPRKRKPTDYTVFYDEIGK